MSSSPLSLSKPQSLSLDPRRVALAADPFEPQNMAELYKFAETVAQTPFCPKDFQGKPDTCFIAMVYGKGLGLSALQALQGVCVINGKPSVYGNTFWAVIVSHPDFVDYTEDLSDPNAAKIVLTRRGRTPWSGKFDKADATTAKLLDKDGVWKQHPQNQMLWRVRHRGADALFPDAMKGIIPREVALDYIEGEVIHQDVPDAKPRPASVQAALEAAKKVNETRESAKAMTFSEAVKPTVAVAEEESPAQENPDPPIGKGNEANLLYAAWRGRQRNPDQVREWISKTFGCETSWGIPRSGFLRAATYFDSAPEGYVPISDDETDVREAYESLGMSLLDQLEMARAFKNDWSKIKTELNRRADAGEL